MFRVLFRLDLYLDSVSSDFPFLRRIFVFEESALRALSRIAGTKKAQPFSIALRIFCFFNLRNEPFREDSYAQIFVEQLFALRAEVGHLRHCPVGLVGVFVGVLFVKIESALVVNVLQKFVLYAARFFAGRVHYGGRELYEFVRAPVVDSKPRLNYNGFCRHYLPCLGQPHLSAGHMHFLP